jgi:hypothetical protein
MVSLSMETAVTLMGPATNFAVVRLPGRLFPGLVVQGDTLHAMVMRLDRAIGLAHGPGDATLVAELEDVLRLLAGMEGRYRAVCEEAGGPAPGENTACA